MSKRLTIILIVLLSILLVLVVGGMIFLMNVAEPFSFQFNISGLSQNLVNEKEITNTDQNLSIDFDVADVIIKPNDSNTIKVEIYGDKLEEYEIIDDSDTIQVTLKENNKNKPKYQFNSKTNHIDIYLPKNYNHPITINGTVGDVSVDEFIYSSLQIKLKTGDVKIQKAMFANIELTSGDIDVGEVTSTLHTTVQNGDLTVQNAHYLVSKITNGDVSIDTVTEHMEIEVKTGDVQIQNAKIEDNSKINVTYGDVTIYKTGKYYVEGIVEVGDVRIKNIDRKSDLELKITVKVGDIRVN